MFKRCSNSFEIRFIENAIKFTINKCFGADSGDIWRIPTWYAQIDSNFSLKSFQANGAQKVIKASWVKEDSVAILASLARREREGWRDTKAKKEMLAIAVKSDERESQVNKKRI